MRDIHSLGLKISLVQLPNEVPYFLKWKRICGILGLCKDSINLVIKIDQFSFQKKKGIFIIRGGKVHKFCVQNTEMNQLHHRDIHLTGQVSVVQS